MPESIAFAHLDLQTQEAIHVGLSHVYPRLSVGAVVMIEDYTRPEAPHVKQACEAFLSDKPERMRRVFGSAQGTFRKLVAPATPSPCLPIEQTLEQLDHLIGELL